MLNWKPSAYVGGGAFLLSSLIGILGKVPFGTLFFRGLLWGVVFGGLAFGADLLLRRFLPELFEREGTEDQGQTVDITIDDENPHAVRFRSGFPKRGD